MKVRRRRQIQLPCLALSFFLLYSVWLFCISQTSLNEDTNNHQPQQQQQPQQRKQEFVLLSQLPLDDSQNNNSNNNTPFCVHWHHNVDEWWSQHPTWELAKQNTTHQCFQLISHREQAALYLQLHQLQQLPNNSSNSNSNCRTKIISNSGWGVDISYMVDGLLYALQHQVPVHMKWNGPWQYAACPQQDARCYFLPFAPPLCSNYEPETSHARYWQTPWLGYKTLQTRWILQYVTRGQTWLRQQAVQWAETVQLPSPCHGALHVRRADVILHGTFSRRYHKIREYVQAYYYHHYSSSSSSPDNNTPQNVLLLTDDANAIGEALEYTKRTQLPWHWHYFQRPRFRGPQGGWENAIPSQDPAMEVAILFATVHLLQQCSTLVHSKSNLADYYFAFMQLAGTDVTRINIDANKRHELIHNAQNAETVRYSRMLQ